MPETTPTDNESPPAKAASLWSRATSRIDALGRWRVVIVIGVALAITFVFIAILNAGAEPAQRQIAQQSQSTPPPNPLKDPNVQRGLLVATTAILIFALLAVTYDIGKVELRAQSLSHRRNVMFAFSLLILAEVFKIDVGDTLGLKTLDPKDNPVKLVNTFAYGVLGFFLIYSFVEYCFTFCSDYLRSRAQWKKSDSVFDGSAVFVIGMYRVLFDILLPALAFAYVVAFFWDDSVRFATKAKDVISCKHQELSQVPSESVATLRATLDNLQERFPDAKPAVQDAKDALEKVVEAVPSQSSEFWFQCRGDKSR